MNKDDSEQARPEDAPLSVLGSEPSLLPRDLEGWRPLIHLREEWTPGELEVLGTLPILDSYFFTFKPTAAGFEVVAAGKDLAKVRADKPKGGWIRLGHVGKSGLVCL